MFLDDTNKNANEFIQVYAWWTSVLVLQMMALTWCTGRLRVKNKIIHSPEDRIWIETPNIILHPTGNGHPDINRIRFVHFNDLEMILFFLISILLWWNTSLNYLKVTNVIRIFSICKMVHTILCMKLIHVPKSIPIFIQIICYCILIYVQVNICLHVTEI